MEIELIQESRKFWTGLKLAAMNRQPGLSWSDLERMNLFDFFGVIQHSEKSIKNADPESKLSRPARRAKD